jgi:hypothetical protein
MTKPTVRALGIVPRYVLQLSFASVIPACAADTGDVSDTAAEASNTVSHSAGRPDPSVIVLATSGFSNKPPQNPAPSTSRSSIIVVLAICGFCGSNNPPQPGVPSATSAQAPDAGSEPPGSLDGGFVDGGYLGDGGELIDGSVATDAGVPDSVDAKAVSTGPELIVLAIQGFANSGNDAG